jgi:hypothetical protein
MVHPRPGIADGEAAAGIGRRPELVALHSSTHDFIRKSGCLNSDDKVCQKFRTTFISLLLAVTEQTTIRTLHSVAQEPGCPGAASPTYAIPAGTSSMPMNLSLTKSLPVTEPRSPALGKSGDLGKLYGHLLASACACALASSQRARRSPRFGLELR